MSRTRLRQVPVLVLGVAGLLTAAIAIIAGGAAVTSPPESGCAPAVSVGSAAAPGVDLDAVQLANARIIYAVGAELGLPEPAEIIAIATALQESGLRDLPYGTSDSVGLFQQRPSQGWGTVAQIMDPVTSARSFYLALTRVTGWQTMSVAGAAQAVQRSAFPGAYTQWQPIATRLAASYAGGMTDIATSASTSAAAGAAAPCAFLDANIVPAVGRGRVALPRHYNLPSATPRPVALAIRFALEQIGTAYQFGGSCTDAHSPDMALHCDCSSLVQQAYLAGGFTLPRTTYAQVDVGTPVYSLAALRPGDLLFTAGSDGTPANPGHVGMYIGDGLIVQAPETGQDVQLSTLSSWASAIVAMRRIA
jgi:cell wall-associated NlpC family hydrolase